MIRFNSILVATDFSSASDAALEYARELARTFGARLRVIHVAENILTRYAFEGSVPMPMDVQTEYERAVGERLNAVLREDDRRELAADTVLRTSNNAADAIVEYAKEADVDVIVVGTHGRKALAHFFLGSVAERVVRLAPCPVLTVRTPERDFLQPDALVVAAATA